MKNTVVKLIAIAFIASFVSCKSSKQGCGLTSDAAKVQPTTIQHTVIAEAK